MNTNHTFLSSGFNTMIKTTFLSVFLVFMFTENLTAQCKAMIKIDGDNTVVDANDKFRLTLPYWLKENQTLAIGASVSKISVLEFNVVNGSTLEFSQVINVTSTSPVTVPVGTVWKIESVAKENNSSTYNRATFASNGTYTWSVPACAEEICIEIWGAGGGGGGGKHTYGPTYRGGGGGGGAFGSQCFAVTPSTTYTIIVGKGGKGGSSYGSSGGGSGSNGTIGAESKVVNPSTVTIISAGGGVNGTGGGVGGTNGTGGAGGTSTASSNASGADGINGDNSVGGAGGAGGNGGAGGTDSSAGGNSGISPAGGGSGSYNGSGGAGADGKVIISW